MEAPSPHEASAGYSPTVAVGAWALETCSFSVTPVTFCGPKAREATTAQSEESTPPESPSTAREKPFFWK